MGLEDQIEELVQKRQKQKAHSEIRKFLKVSNQKNSIFIACDWYRRLGMFQEGFKLVSDLRPFDGMVSTGVMAGLKTLWMARFLALIGCSFYATALAKLVKAQTAREHQYIAEIYLGNFEHEQALREYKFMREKDSDPNLFQARMGLLGFSDTLVALGSYEKAIEIANEVLGLSSEELVKGICYQVLGEYYARAKQFDEAESYLKKAFPYFKDDNFTPDYGLLLKWQGYVEYSLGQKQQGLDKMNQAIKLFKSLYLREEAWLDVMRLKLELNLLNENETNKLIHFPALPKGFQKMLPPSQSGLVGAQPSDWLIDFVSNEFHLKGKVKYNIPLELKLMAHVRLAEGDGLSIERIYPILWSDEIFSYLQLKNRVFQLLNRIRQIHGIEIQVKKNRLIMNQGDIKKVSVRVGEFIGPSILKKNKNLIAKDVSDYYGISSSQTHEVMRGWLENNWLEKKGRGRGTHYLSKIK